MVYYCIIVIVVREKIIIIISRLLILSYYFARSAEKFWRIYYRCGRKTKVGKLLRLSKQGFIADFFRTIEVRRKTIERKTILCTVFETNAPGMPTYSCSFKEGKIVRMVKTRFHFGVYSNHPGQAENKRRKN